MMDRGEPVRGVDRVSATVASWIAACVVVVSGFGIAVTVQDTRTGYVAAEGESCTSELGALRSGQDAQGNAPRS